MAGEGSDRRTLALLAVGVVAGLLAAAVGLLRPHPSPLPASAVARVDGVPIARARYERALASLSEGRRVPLGEAERRLVLERLIDEELLVQRGLALGLPQHGHQVRAELVAGAMQAVVAEAQAAEPSEAELRAFFATERELFRGPGRLRVESVFVRSAGSDDEASRGRAERAAARLRAGEPLAPVAAALGDPSALSPPDAALPPSKLGDYLGPTALRASLALAPGEVAGPLRTAGGWRVVRLVERETPREPGFDALRDEVHAAWRRRQGEQALRRHLDALRGEARVELREDLDAGAGR